MQPIYSAFLTKLKFILDIIIPLWYNKIIPKRYKNFN